MAAGWVLATLLISTPSEALAQCVVEGTVGVIDVSVDRGDGVVVPIRVRSTPVTITIPVSARRPLAVEVRGALAFSGTTRSDALSLRAGTYSGGLIEVPENGRAVITAARSEGGDVGIELYLGTRSARAREIVVPCAALTTIAPRLRRRRSTTLTQPPPPPLLASRRSRLELRSEPADRPSLVLADLERWNALLETIETSGAWTRVRVRGSGVILEGWTRARGLAPPSRVPRGVVERPRQVRCGIGIGGPHDPQHALIAEGTAVSLVAGGSAWTTTSGDRSFLVRLFGEHAEILAAPDMRADNEVWRCPVHVVLGLVPTGALDREVFAHPDLRVRRDARGRLLIEHGSDALRSELSTGDLVIALDGVPLDRRTPAYMHVRQLVRWGRSLSVTVLRDGVVLEIPQLEHGASQALLLQRPPTDLERELAD